ncbi:MAG: SDR family oxidoreductase [Ruminococcaceae bacterium]|nr:SDR family oxidoreductase [Oscillospiraceae bacterium]
MEKKYILVTGASGGMGKATVKLLTERGYTVFALDRTEYEATPNVIPLVCDLTDEQSVVRSVEKTMEYTDNLFAVVHFAGIYMLDSLVEMESGAFDKILDVNLRGAFLVNKAFLPLLGDGSRIVITTSELAPLDPLPFTGIYAVTKSALDKYAYSLRMELQLLGISVSVLRAGAVSTDMLGVSTDALDKFVEKTELYSCNAARFKSIVERVEARNITPDKLGKKVVKMLGKSNPRFAYTINRNPLLLMLNILPKRLQLWIIKQVLK